MSLTQFSSSEFRRNAMRAQEAAKGAPVIITERGKPAHVLLSFEEYQRLTRQRRNIADALAMPGAF
jgi:prevent-host-death family protein